MAQLSSLTVNDTGNLTLPNGTIAQRTNNTLQTVSFTTPGSGTWLCPAGVTSIELLMVAGGGSGGSWYGGGGGGGGVIYNPAYPVVPGRTYQLSVGAGGTGNTGTGNNGGNTTFDLLTAVGGGAGGTYFSNPTYRQGNAGGSGGGSSFTAGGGAGTIGQGNKGGTNSYPDNSTFGNGGSGGGGAGTPGEDYPGDNTDSGGNGGDGILYSISGTPTYYAGGGGGGTGGYNNGNRRVGLGGKGGGGNGGTYNAGAGTSAPANTGGGGGGTAGGSTPSNNAASGGSGVIYIRYALATDSRVATAQTRFNSTLNRLESFKNNKWQPNDAADFVKNGLRLHLDAAYYSSGTTWYDLSGFNYNATLIGSPTYNTEGSFTLNNSGSQTISVSKPNPDIISDSYSFEMWVYLTDITGSPSIYHKGNHYTLRITGTNSYQWADSSNYSYSSYGTRTASGIGTLNTWRQVVVTKDKLNAVRVYLNGRLVDTRTGFGSALTSVDSTLWLWGYSDTDTLPTTMPAGKISIVRAYDRALTDEEIVQNYNNNCLRHQLPKISFNDPREHPYPKGGLVLDLDLSQSPSYKRGSYAVWHDLSGNVSARLNNGQVKYATQGLNFDGSDDYVYLGTSAFAYGVNTANSNNFTFESVVLLRSYGSPSQTYLARSMFAKGNVYMNWCIQTNGTVNLYHYDGSPRNTFSGLTVSLNTWTHIVTVVEKQSVRHYVNGVGDTTTTTWYGIQSAGLSVSALIGRTDAGGSSYWDGEIAVARNYDYALNHFEVMDLYRTAKSRFGVI